MREKHTLLKSIFHFFADHEIGQELQAVSGWLDNYPEVLDRVVSALFRGKLWSSRAA